MTLYTVCCGYASHYHNTVTVEADTLDEALEKAIEQAGDDPHWKSADYCGPTFVEALAEGEDADPWGDTAIPIPDRFTQNGEPPVVTLTGPRPPGGIEVAGGTVRIRFAASDPANGTVTMELSDPPPPPANKPPASIHRNHPIHTIRSQGTAASPAPRASSYPTETLLMKLLTSKQRERLLANGAQLGADHKPVVKLFNPTGAGTWLLTELDPKFPGEIAFGLADLGMGFPELGDIGLLELFEFRGRFGLGIERDLHFRPKYRISTYAEAASAAGRIVEFGPELDAAARIRAEAEVSA